MPANKLSLPKKYAERTLTEFFNFSTIAELSPNLLPMPIKKIADSHYRIYVGQSDSLVEKLPKSVQRRLKNKLLSGMLAQSSAEGGVT